MSVAAAKAFVKNTTKSGLRFSHSNDLTIFSWLSAKTPSLKLNYLENPFPVEDESWFYLLGVFIYFFHWSIRLQKDLRCQFSSTIIAFLLNCLHVKDID